MKRRHLIATVAATLAAPAVISSARAQGFPNKQVRILIPYAPGGTSDILARLLQPHLQAALGQTVVVENRVGANGNIAVDMVAKSPPDGYTVVLTDLGNLTISPAVMKLPFDVAKDFNAVTVLAYSPHLLAANPDRPYKTVPELIAYAKANPDKLNYATAGLGSAPHLAGALFAHSLGLKITFIPMKGGAEAIQQVVGGHADALFNGMIATLPHVKNGKLRGLAVSSAKRSELAPDLPTVSEASGIKDFVTGSWQGILAAKGTPPEVLERLYVEIDKATKIPEVAARLKELGAEPVLTKPAQSDAWRAKEVENWAKVVKDTGIKLE
ncbi:MAG: tripartite tricarboxylate transporter substrate binding protein [Reyranella sp.]|nr:MAG: tripartite tricarboxylate transporter substrate binding protein [Reyranella sp.]